MSWNTVVFVLEFKIFVDFFLGGVVLKGGKKQ